MIFVAIRINLDGHIVSVYEQHMSRKYVITCIPYQGLWHARIEPFPDLIARGESPFNLLVELRGRLAALLGHDDFEVALHTPGVPEGAYLEQVRLGTLEPAITPDAIRTLIDKHGLTRYANQILEGTKPAILIRATRHTDLTPLPVGRSRFGGDPDLPRNMPWPTSRGRPLAMLAQLRLSELPIVSNEAAEFALPHTGFLWFWYDEIGGSWRGTSVDSDGPFRVTFIPDESSPLYRVSSPSELQKFRMPYQPCTLAFKRIASLPCLEYSYSSGDLERSFELCAEVQADAGHNAHYLRGNYPGYLVECGRDHPVDTELICTIASDADGPGWGFGDVGSVNFWIRRDDLRCCDFSKAWGAIDSS